MTAYAYSEGPYDPDKAETEVFYLDYLEEQDKPEPEPETWRYRFGKWSAAKLRSALARGRAIVAILVSMVLLIGAGAWAWAAGGVRFNTPESTAFMRTNPDPIHQWVGMNHISRHLVASAMALEDAEIGARDGAIDWDAFTATAEGYLRGEEVVGGSTIHQQLVKNLYLTADQTVTRKAVEALIAIPLAQLVPESRVLELYLNFAQLGPNIYGVCSATWYYFDSPPWYVSELQASQLMAVLPLPSLARRAEGGGMYVAGDAELEDWYYDRVYVRSPGGIAYRGGYQALMDQVGIVGVASDYEHVGPDSCSTMPEGVRELRESEAAE